MTGVFHLNTKAIQKLNNFKQNTMILRLYFYFPPVVSQ